MSTPKKVKEAVAAQQQHSLQRSKKQPQLIVLWRWRHRVRGAGFYSNNKHAIKVILTILEHDQIGTQKLNKRK